MAYNEGGYEGGDSDGVIDGRLAAVERVPGTDAQTGEGGVASIGVDAHAMVVTRRTRIQRRKAAL